jgi:protein TonB
MRRRRQKNPLLGRIVGISILVHIILLPILAYFGAFKKIQQHFVQTQMVMLPAPEIPREKQVEKKAAPKTVKAKTAPTNKGKTSPNHSQAHAVHSNLNQPKIALAQGGTAGDGSAQQGTGAPGVVPTDPNAKKTGPTTPDNGGTTTPPVKPVVQEPLKPEKAVVQAPIKQPDPPKIPTPTQPATPKEAVFTSAQPISDSQPKPTIPDDLRSDALDKTFIAEFTVGEDGAPMQVKAVQSTGNDELDRRALDAAKKWRFKPATRDGLPVVGKVRLFIEFQVS